MRLKLLPLMLLLGTVLPALAQAPLSEAALPSSYTMPNLGREFQSWNNCGPATLTNALVHFGYSDDQFRAANWLKPHYEDKNVSPWQMAEFVNTQIPELAVFALVRSGGTIELLQRLLVNGFPVIIEKGYEPEGYDWMGHYLLLSGYDDSTKAFRSMDSFKGPNTRYTYEELTQYWQHFNYSYIVLVPVHRELELMDILGDDADEWQNHINTLEMARAEAVADQEDAHAWFNMGSSFLNLGMFEAAGQAYDRAIALGLPWRMFWYQFGALEAYHALERYGDMLRIARQNQNDGGGQYVEETYYYLGLAREGQGETQLALQNYIAALEFNRNFHPARAARDRLRSQG